MPRRREPDPIPRGIEVREGPEGARYRCRYRLDGGHKVATYSTLEAAKVFKAIQKANGTQAAHEHYEQQHALLSAHEGRQADRVNRRPGATATAAQGNSLAGVTLAEYAERTLGPVDPRYGTRIGHDKTRERYLKRYLAGAALGRMRVTALTRQDVQAWIDWLSVSGSRKGASLSPKMVRNVASWLSTVLDHAVESGLIAANPASGTRKPRNRRVRTIHVLTEAELRWAMEHTPEHYRLFITTVALTGMRYQEAAALRVEHIDLARGVIRVETAVEATMVTSIRIEGDTRTASSIRSIAIPPSLVQQLRAHVAGRPRTDHVFVNMAGRPIRSGVLRKNVLEPLNAEFEPLSGKRITMHGFRHSFATNHLESGVSVQSLSPVLGHSSPTTTYRSYSHAVDGAQQAMAARLEALLAGDEDAAGE